MSTNDTYEAGDIKTSLEKYEWDDIWQEQTHIKDKFRIFYIGDSISRGIRKRITAISDGEILCSGYATSKAVDNPDFKDMIRLALNVTKCDAVLFNNGLHGWHISEKEYAEHYDEIVRYILGIVDAPLCVVTTTATKDSHTDRAKARNAEALEIARAHGLRVIDLYSESERISDNIKDDGVHFDDEGYDILAKFIIKEFE